MLCYTSSSLLRVGVMLFYTLRSMTATRFASLLIGGVMGTLILGGFTGHLGYAKQYMAQHMPVLQSALGAPDTTIVQPTAFTVGAHPNHPEARYDSYLTSDLLSDKEENAVQHQFHRILDLYTKRQGVDDNFTIRVFDSRTYESLGAYSLDDMRTRWENGQTYDWGEVDRHRRQLSRRAVDRYVDEGYSRSDLAVRWGRANQIHEAYERDLPFAEYEMRLAQYLDMSLLPTMLGVVETFNQDHLVSTAGARSRYQMMPYILRQFDINTYRLPAQSGAHVRVEEELHPLLAMEPAFTLMRGYINAVGHEIPGLSAYHTGPSNIFHVYRSYLLDNAAELSATPSVVDAFMWGLTDGFETVSESSSFKARSRGYIPAVMGAMRAYNPNVIDPSYTVRAVRVQLAEGEEIRLASLLADLADERLDWGEDTHAMSMYERFRYLNPHIKLPDPYSGHVPAAGNILLRSDVSGQPIRFFLPLGAPDLIEASGRVELDEEATFVYDGGTYTRPRNGEQTEADRSYARLVEDIGQFGFTNENKRRLERLYETFQELAEEEPSHYRQIQLEVISTHRRIWQSNAWNEMARTASAATRLTPATPQGLRSLEPGQVDGS